MPIVQALRTLAPGRVTRRFGYEHEYRKPLGRPPGPRHEEQTLAVEDFCAEFHEEGHVQMRVGAAVQELRCVRPWKVMLTAPPKSVLNTSNAQLLWRSQIIPTREDERLRFEPPRDSVWGSIIREVCFFTHNQHTHVEVRRFAVGSRAGISVPRRDPTRYDGPLRRAGYGGGGGRRLHPGIGRHRLPVPRARRSRPVTGPPEPEESPVVPHGATSTPASRKTRLRASRRIPSSANGSPRSTFLRSWPMRPGKPPRSRRRTGPSTRRSSRARWNESSRSSS